ncbi:DUF354 domain-containing protein [Natronoglomus mannanivorans]|uniref:DUF354 domain-containing protein n=1 Tax=Natronoglomus mannanivorans TaxID=2979990 RepID=A0AAP2YXQ3_9EURY|nr:DUF354 domain-containing protein [Halobacteria archaeon AArc-xg1-1]
MKYLFFTNTPAHVHLYKHTIDQLQAQGHDVLVLGREYGCTEALLEYHDLPYEIYGKCDTTKFSLFRELPKQYLNIFRITRRYDPDWVFGVGAYAAHAGAITGTPVTLVLDTEPTSIDHSISRPFVNTFLTPDAFQKDLGKNHYRFKGFKESAYLHPDVFEPTCDVREKLGVEQDEPYVIVRLNAFGSHHDVGKSGFTDDQRRRLLETLSTYATVFVSDEGGTFDFDDIDADPFDLHPARIHDALAEANLLVADTQTMVTEAALLGTPAIRSNSFVGESDMGNFVELEANDLICNCVEFEHVLDRARELLGRESIEEEWTRRRDEYVEATEMVDLTELLTELALTAARHEPAGSQVEEREVFA